MFINYLLDWSPSNTIFGKTQHYHGDEIFFSQYIYVQDLKTTHGVQFLIKNCGMSLDEHKKNQALSSCQCH